MKINALATHWNKFIFLLYLLFIIPKNPCQVVINDSVNFTMSWQIVFTCKMVSRANPADQWKLSLNTSADH